MQDAIQAPFKLGDRAWRVVRSLESYTVAEILQLAPEPGERHVIKAWGDPGPTMAFPDELEPYDGEYDKRRVSVTLRDRHPLPDGQYTGTIVASERPGNTSFWVKLDRPAAQPPINVWLSDITFN